MWAEMSLSLKFGVFGGMITPVISDTGVVTVWVHSSTSFSRIGLSARPGYEARTVPVANCTCQNGSHRARAVATPPFTQTTFQEPPSCEQYHKYVSQCLYMIVINLIKANVFTISY